MRTFQVVAFGADMAARTYTPRTTLACGIARLGDVIATTPKTRKNQRKPCLNQANPAKPMQNTSKPSIPAKPAAKKRRLADEDYSTPYRSPAIVLPAQAAIKTGLLSGVEIEDDVPLPSDMETKMETKIVQVRTLLQRMQPGQSVLLDDVLLSTVAKAICQIHKAQQGHYTRRRADGKLRVWRVA